MRPIERAPRSRVLIFGPRCRAPPPGNRVGAELTPTPPTPPGVRVRTGRFA